MDGCNTILGLLIILFKFTYKQIHFQNLHIIN